MGAGKQILGLVLTGGALAVVLWSSAGFTPIIKRVAGIIGGEVNAATADGGGGNGWGG